MGVQFADTRGAGDVDFGDITTDDIEPDKQHASLTKGGTNLRAEPTVPVSQRASYAFGPCREVAAVVGGSRNTGQRIGHRYSVHEDDARVATGDDFRQITLNDGVLLAIAGEGFEHGRRVLVTRVEDEDATPTHAVERLADRLAMLGEEGVHIWHGAGDERRRAALREPGGKHLLVHIPQALRSVHHQTARCFSPFQNVRGVDVFRVERRVFAHQQHVEAAQRLGHSIPVSEPVVEILAHGDGAGPAPSGAIP